MARKPKTISAVRPNEGVRMAYQKRLDRLLSEMERSVMFWVGAAWRANPPIMAEDASPSADLEAAMRRLSRRWLGKWNKAADELADYFARDATERSDAALRSILKRNGISVQFKMTAAARDVLNAVTAENVALIRSIPAQYLVQVQGSVMRAAAVGRDLSTLTAEIEAHGGVSRRRAKFIARDQTNKATAAMTRARQEELGITEAIWLHSGGGKKRRPEHVAFSGQRYDVRKGAFLEGKWTWPGHEPGCRCVSKSVVPGF